VVYWLRGEGYGDFVDAPTIERFLGVDAASGITHLDRLVDDGYLVRDDDWYALSDRGLRTGEESSPPPSATWSAPPTANAAKNAGARCRRTKPRRAPHNYREQESE